MYMSTLSNHAWSGNTLHVLGLQRVLAKETCKKSLWIDPMTTLCSCIAVKRMFSKAAHLCEGIERVCSNSRIPSTERIKIGVTRNRNVHLHVVQSDVVEVAR